MLCKVLLEHVSAYVQGAIISLARLQRKVLCNSPCIILRFAGMLLRSEHHEYHNLRQI